MKPSDFKIPEKRLQGKNVIHDRIVHLKKCGFIPGRQEIIEKDETFEFPAWDHPEFFGNSNPIHLEYCSGNGAWIAERAAANPNINWVAVEIKLGRTRKIWSKIKNLKLDNLIVINGEGKLATEWYFPKKSVDSIYINFPDPWPKRHHAKNRIVNPSFVEALHKILKDNGEVTIVTDDPSFSEWTLKIFKNSSLFECSLPAPHYQTKWDNYGNSYFETLWREKGLTIRYHHFKKK